MALFLPGRRNASGTDRSNAWNLGEPVRGLIDDGEGDLPEGINDAAGVDWSDSFHQAGAEVALHPLHGGREGGSVLSSLELPPMLGVVAPPAMSDNRFPRLQVRQGADEGDEPLIVDCGGCVTGASFWSEASDGEAVLGVLKRDPLDHPTQLTPGWCLGN